VLAPSPGISVCTAGPGSGKTRVLAHRVAYLLHHHQVSPSSVLALTFTNKAGQEMKARIGSLLNDTEVSQRVSVGTFHSFCSRLLRTFGGDVLAQLTGNAALNRDFTIYDRDDSLRVIKSLLNDKKMGSLLPKDVLQIIAQRKAKEIADWTGSSGAPYAAPTPVARPYSGLNSSMIFRPELEGLFRDYTDSLHLSNALDFDDLLLFGWRLLRDYPEVRRRVQRRFQHVLVDEYQDTNLPQYEIIRLLYCDKYLYSQGLGSPLLNDPLSTASVDPSPDKVSSGSSAANSNAGSATIIARSNSFSHARDAAVAPARDAVAPTTSNNSDSSGTLSRTLFVVGDANQAIYSWRGALPGNMHRIRQDYPTLASLYGLKENYRCSPPIAAAANALLGGNVTVSSAEYTNLSSTSERRFSPVQVVTTKNDAHEARVVADLLNTYSGFGKSKAVLYRTNAQSRQLETALMDAQMPYKIIGGLKFYERREVKDVLSYLKLLANPRDLLAAKRTVNTPMRGIGPVTQEAFFAWVRDSSRKAEQQHLIAPSLLDYLHAVALLADHEEEDADLAAFDAQHHFADFESDVEDDNDCAEFSQRSLYRKEASSMFDNGGDWDGDRYSDGSDKIESGSESDGEDHDHDHNFTLHQELAQSCPLTRRELNVMSKYASLMLRLDKFSRQHSLTNLTRHIVASTNMAEHLKKISKDKDEEQDRRENLEELLKGTVKYVNSTQDEGVSKSSMTASRLSLIKFIEHVALFSSDDSSGSSLDLESDGEDSGDVDEGEGDASVPRELPVQMMTIHSSKGLEFDVVVVCGVEEGCLPLVRRRGDEASQTLEEEERRLAYVAMTRAKADLVLTHRRRTLQLRRNRLVSKKAKPSRYLKPLSKMKRKDCIFVDKTSAGDDGRTAQD